MSADVQTPGVAIVGMAGRFPGARDVETFWRNIKAGKESVTRFSRDQLEIEIEGNDGADYVCAKGALDDIDLFDARFFGAATAPGDEVLEGLGSRFGDRLDVAVTQVANPPDDAKAACFVLCGRAVRHALHEALDDEVNTANGHSRGALPRRRRHRLRRLSGDHARPGDRRLRGRDRDAQGRRRCRLLRL